MLNSAAALSKQFSIFTVHSLQPTHPTLKTQCLPHLTSPHLSPNPQRGKQDTKVKFIDEK